MDTQRKYCKNILISITMKNIVKLLSLTLAVAVFFASCDTSNQGATASAAAIDHKVDMEGTRGVQMVDLAGSQVSIAKADILQLSEKMASNDDEDAVNNIMNNLMAAENEAQQLNINFTMSDEPVEEGLFVFGIETETEKELTLQMFDEEGYSMAANNAISVTAGNNYKALNVKSLSNGIYYFKLKDDAGKELTRKVTIDHK